MSNAQISIPLDSPDVRVLQAQLTVQHMSILGRPVYLWYRPKRHRCDTCDGRPTTTQQLAWHTPNSPQTNAIDTHLLLQLVNATLEDVRLKERVPYDVVLGVLKRRIDQQVDWTRHTRLGVLGLDEIALKKASGLRCDRDRPVARQSGVFAVRYCRCGAFSWLC